MMIFLYTGMSVMVPMYWVILSRYFTEISCTCNITNINYSDPAICEILRQAESKCTREGRYADYTYDNCERYVLCTQENNIFIQTSFACPDSYIFDPEKSMCVSSDLYECPCSTKNTTISNNEILSQVVTVHNDPQFPDASQSTNINNSTLELCSQNTQECLSFGKLPDYSTPGCTSFYTCVRTEEDYFSKLHFKCPHGYVFDADHEVCTMSNNYNCPCNYSGTAILESTTSPPHQIANLSQVTTNSGVTSSDVPPLITDNIFETNFKPLVNYTNEPILDKPDVNDVFQHTINTFHSTTPQSENTDKLNSIISTYPDSESSTKFTGEENISTTHSNLSTTGIEEPTTIGIHTIIPSTIAPNINSSEGTTEQIYTESVVQQTYTSEHSTTLLDLQDETTLYASLQPDSISINNSESSGVTITNVSMPEITTKLPNTSPALIANTEFPNTIDSNYSTETTISIPVTQLYNFTDISNTVKTSIPEFYSTTQSIADVDFQTETSGIERRPECELRHCNATGRVPDYSVSDCRGYLLCLSTGSNYLEFKYTCPPPNIFDPNLQICTLPTLYLCPCSNYSSTTSQSDINATTDIPVILGNPKNASTANDVSITETYISLGTESTSLPPQTEPLALDCMTSSCRRSERIADYNISECGGYISCVPLGDGSFLKLKYRCPNSSVFNPITQICTSPDLYTCPCSTPSESTTIISINTEATTYIAMKTCTDDGFFDDVSSTDCSGYIQCVNIDGVLKEINLLCPPNSYFDPTAKLCSATYVCPINTTYDTTAVTSPVTHMTTIETSNTSQIPAQLSNDCPIISCTKQQRIPDNSVPDCKSYITCLPSTGGIFLELKLNCPSPNIFNPDLGICVLPENYNCSCNLASVNLELSTASNIASSTESITTTNLDDLVTYSQLSSGCNFTNSNCTEAGAVPDYRYPGCKKFRLCRLEADSYIDFSYECTENYVFDPSRSACTHSMYYTCPC